jgi:hypothetical protein
MSIEIEGTCVVLPPAAQASHHGKPKMAANWPLGHRRTADGGQQQYSAGIDETGDCRGKAELAEAWAQAVQYAQAEALEAWNALWQLMPGTRDLNHDAAACEHYAVASQRVAELAICEAERATVVATNARSRANLANVQHRQHF